MHSQLQRLIDANTRLEDAERALAEAQEHRRQCARDLSRIEDRAERTDAAVYAYKTFGKGLSIVLAEAVTGLPGKKGQSEFLVLCNRKTYLPKGRSQAFQGIVHVDEPMTEWPKPDMLQREVIASHLNHGRPYWLQHGLGWTNVSVSLSPHVAQMFLEDPTAALAARFDMSREDFVAWLSTGGNVRCDGFYDNGNRCTSRVASVRGQLPLHEWKPAWEAGGYCKRHGGDASAATSS